MKHLILLVGPPGAGKSTLAETYEEKGFLRISQDESGKDHLRLFSTAIMVNQDIIVDRLNFNKVQRDRYLVPAKAAGYETGITVLHENKATCLKRCLARQDHPTIKTAEDAENALRTFFSKYERVEDSEADKVTRVWPEGFKPDAVIFDLDGTLCNIDHRLHNVKNGDKNWKAFFEGIKDDVPNKWCLELAKAVGYLGNVVFCSGRPNDYRQATEDWLSYQGLGSGPNYLFMRASGDYRSDDIAKEIILDFELLTRYNPTLFIDDRARVVKLWRRRGFTCLDCSGEDF